MALKTQKADTAAKLTLLGGDTLGGKGVAFLQHIVDRTRVHYFGPWEVCDCVCVFFL
jgi:hypothetical protein